MSNIIGNKIIYGRFSAIPDTVSVVECWSAILKVMGSSPLIFLNFMNFKLPVSFLRRNTGTKTLHKILHIYPEKLGTSMNRACTRVLTFPIYVVK